MASDRPLPQLENLKIIVVGTVSENGPGVKVKFGEFGGNIRTFERQNGVRFLYLLARKINVLDGLRVVRTLLPNQRAV